MWQRNAACRDADPILFDAPDWMKDDTVAQFKDVAAVFCDGCPVARKCAEIADEGRLIGLFGGVLRRVHKGRYVYDVLLPEASAPQLTERPVGVGWFA